MPSLKDVRTSKGISQQALASMAGISLKTVSKIETGHAVTPAIKRVLCLALGTNDIDIVVSNRVKRAQNREKP